MPTHTREQLYDQLWSEPALKVAARHGLSSTYLARVCEALNVPRPARGYWAKIEHGQAPKRVALPAARPGDPLLWAPGPALPPMGHRGSSALRPPVVGSRHPLLAGAAELFTADWLTDGGHLRLRKRNIAVIFTSKGALPRALDTANQLYLLFEKKGCWASSPCSVPAGVDRLWRGILRRHGTKMNDTTRRLIGLVIGLALLVLAQPARAAQARASSPCASELAKAKQEIAVLKLQLAIKETSRSGEMAQAMRALKALKGVSTDTTYANLETYFAQAKAASGSVEDPEELAMLNQVLSVYSEALSQWRRGSALPEERLADHVAYGNVYPVYTKCMAAGGWVIERDAAGAPLVGRYPFRIDMAKCLLVEARARTDAIR